MYWINCGLSRVGHLVQPLTPPIRSRPTKANFAAFYVGHDHGFRFRAFVVAAVFELRGASVAGVENATPGTGSLRRDGFQVAAAVPYRLAGGECSR
jgi:hypothetical protein